MRGPKPPAVILTESQRRGPRVAHPSPLRRPSKLVLRARIILAAADGLNNSQIARLLGISIPTARLWRDRWVGLQAVPEADLDRRRSPGRCPAAGPAAADHRRAGLPDRRPGLRGPRAVRRPITHWSGREIADEIVKRGIVDRHLAPPRGAALKDGGPQAAPGAALADAGARRAASRPPPRRCARLYREAPALAGRRRAGGQHRRADRRPGAGAAPPGRCRWPPAGSSGASSSTSATGRGRSSSTATWSPARSFAPTCGADADQGRLRRPHPPHGRHRPGGGAVALRGGQPGHPPLRAAGAAGGRAVRVTSRTWA